jgi:hypothetical protein
MKITVTDADDLVLYEGEGASITCTESAESVDPGEPEPTPYPGRPDQGLPGRPGGGNKPTNPIVLPPGATPKK